jgi:hypothetical protein
MEPRRHRAGETTADLCRACKLTRDHTVMAVDADGRILRVVCDFCRSEHNYRGGGEEAEDLPAPRARTGERERMEPRMSTSTSGPPDDELDRRLRRVLREELGLTPVPLADKWRGGELVLRPGKPGLQEKKWPLETFFNKVIMIRNKLRTLEQQVNGSELTDDAKVRLQAYITGCYGSLTSFNALFADEDDHFKGTGGT